MGVSKSPASPATPGPKDADGAKDVGVETKNADSKRKSEVSHTYVRQPASAFWLEPLELHQKLGLELVEAKDGYARTRMPVAGNAQVSGILHGGATALLMEATAGYAAMSKLSPQSSEPSLKDATEEPGSVLVAVGTEMSISHLRAVSAGFVEASAEPIHLGKTRMIHQVQVYRSTDSKLVSTGVVTHAVTQVQNQAQGAANESTAGS